MKKFVFRVETHNRTIRFLTKNGEWCKDPKQAHVLEYNKKNIAYAFSCMECYSANVTDWAFVEVKTHPSLRVVDDHRWADAFVISVNARENKYYNIASIYGQSIATCQVYGSLSAASFGLKGALARKWHKAVIVPVVREDVLKPGDVLFPPEDK